MNTNNKKRIKNIKNTNRTFFLGVGVVIGFSFIAAILFLVFCNPGPVDPPPDYYRTKTSSSTTLSSKPVESSIPGTTFGYTSSSSVNIEVNTDFSAPTLTGGPTTSDVTFSEATMTWETDEACGCQLEYFPGEFPVSKGFRVPAEIPTEENHATNHTLDLTILTHSTEYTYYIICTDSAYNQRVFGPYEFTTEPTSAIDNMPPIITDGPDISDITDVGATWDWATNEASTSEIEYSSDGLFAIGSGTRVTIKEDPDEFFHTMTITGLEPATTYSYYILSRDEYGNLGISSLLSFDTAPYDSRLGWIGAGGSGCGPSTCLKKDNTAGSTSCASGGLYNPAGIDVDHAGNILIAGWSWSDIQKYEGDGYYRGWVGTREGGTDCNDYEGQSMLSFSTSAYTTTAAGSALGDFNVPADVSVDHNQGLFYAADRNNHRIQRWSLSGRINPDGECWLGGDTSGWHSAGTPSGNAVTRFSSPQGVACDDSYVYIADTGNHRIMRYEILTGVFAGCIGGGVSSFNTDSGICSSITSGNGDTFFNTPMGISVTDGYIYIADAGNHRVQFWDIAGVYQGWIGGGLTTGYQVGVAPAADSGEGCFNYPTKIATDDEGILYIADTNNHRVQKWDSTGTCMGWIGSTHNSFVSGGSPAVAGAALGTFNGPRGVAYDSVIDRLYVSDSNNHRIQVFEF